VITGYTIASTGGTIASYSISPAAGNGLTFNTSSGLLTGTPTAQALLVTYTISAHNATAPDATQTFAVTVSASGGGGGGGGSGGGGGGGGSTPTPLLSIEFTDQTLRSPTIGVLYSDRLTARTLSNGSPDSHVITYALASDSPDLPLGLVLNSTTGFVTGIIESSVLSGTINLLFTASSPGYTSVTTTVLSHMVVQAAEIVPSEVLVADIPATEIVDSQTAIETTLDPSSTEKPIQPKNKLMMTALFANNSSILSKAQIAAIKTLSKSLLQMNIKTITIVGFTNAAPSVGNNKLAIARAKTLARYLKLNGVKQSITIKSVVTAKAKANQSVSALIALRKAEIWIVS
jgi:outer membrane protein OmpA-like peptidoglycan-associated protein